MSLGLDAVTMPDGVDLVDRLRQSRIELVWLNTGGVQGECPLAQTPALLETAGIPYVGHTPLNAALLDDKGLFKLACSGLGLSTAPFIIHNPAAGRVRPHKSPAFKAAFGDYKGPFIVKPVNGEQPVHAAAGLATGWLSVVTACPHLHQQEAIGLLRGGSTHVLYCLGQLLELHHMWPCVL